MKEKRNNCFNFLRCEHDSLFWKIKTGYFLWIRNHGNIQKSVMWGMTGISSFFFPPGGGILFYFLLRRYLTEYLFGFHLDRVLFLRFWRISGFIRFIFSLNDRSSANFKKKNLIFIISKENSKGTYFQRKSSLISSEKQVRELNIRYFVVNKYYSHLDIVLSNFNSTLELSWDSSWS